MPTFERSHTISLFRNPETGKGQSAPAGGALEPGYLVIIVAGQSNGRGNAIIRSGIDDDYTGLGHVYQWDSSTGSIIAAANPLKHQDIYANGTGFWLQFAKNLPTNRNVLIVPVAKGATGFGIHWNAGQAVYNEAVARIQAALATDPLNTLGALLWHQGETDASNNNTDYVTSITNMRNSMIAAVTKFTESTPFIVGAIKPNGTAERLMINTALQTFERNVPAVKFVDTTDLPVAGDGTHFTAEALESIGQRYYNAYSSGLTLLKVESFKYDTLASKTWIALNQGNENSAAIVDISGTKYLRHNLHGANVSVDQISGKTRSGLYSHSFTSNNYYDSANGNEITFEQEFYFDDCWWKDKASSPDAYPIIAGKMFLCDTTVDSNACYLGLTDDGVLTFVSGNDGVTNNVFAPASSGGWANRAYGPRNGSGAVSNFIYFDTASNPIFQSDGVVRKLTFEIKYNPSGIGYHKGRFKANGTVLHDSLGVNTDANGWFNLPIEYKFKGTRIYASSVDLNSPLDYSTDPATYTGYAAGYNVKHYAIYYGVID